MTKGLLPGERIGRLPEKEEQVLTLLAQGLKTIEIAETLGITTHYVYFLARMLRLRFSVDTNVAVVSHAIAEGIITADGKLVRSDQSQETRS